MSRWPSTRSHKVLAGLHRIGWTIKRQPGTSHRVLIRAGWPDYVLAFHVLGAGSRVLFDGKPIMVDGRFVHPPLKALNPPAGRR